MTITIRITVELDIESAAKVLMLAHLPDAPTVGQAKAAIAAVLARDGADGALRRYRNLRYSLAGTDEADEHDSALAACRLLAQRAYPPPKPRPRPPRPTPQGRPLIDVLTEFDE